MPQPFYWWDEPPAFGNCSIVGSSESLRGAALGALIDRHDTVVRVNRLGKREPEELVDLGKRTDVLFTTLCNVKPEAMLWVPLPGRSVITANAHLNCNLRSGEGCKFRTLVLRGPPKCAEFLHRLRGPRLAVPVAVQHEELVREATQLLRGASGHPRGLEPSTGFHAALTLAMHCHHVTLFGFDGEQTYDGHAITKEHPLALEHSILQRLTHGPVGGLPAGWAAGRLSYGSRPPITYNLSEPQRPRLAGARRAGRITEREKRRRT